MKTGKGGLDLERLSTVNEVWNGANKIKQGLDPPLSDIEIENDELVIWSATKFL